VSSAWLVAYGASKLGLDRTMQGSGAIMAHANASRAIRHDERAAFDEERIRERLADLVRERPIIAMVAVGAAGAALGGLVFSRLGRLCFAVAAGYVTNELWHREGRLDIDDVVERLLR
jgi:hypothetical protein